MGDTIKLDEYAQTWEVPQDLLLVALVMSIEGGSPYSYVTISMPFRSSAVVNQCTEMSEVVISYRESAYENMFFGRGASENHHLVHGSGRGHLLDEVIFGPYEFIHLWTGSSENMFFAKCTLELQCYQA